MEQIFKFEKNQVRGIEEFKKIGNVIKKIDEKDFYSFFTS